jgi:perosamine synthetase
MGRVHARECEEASHVIVPGPSPGRRLAGFRLPRLFDPMLSADVERRVTPMTKAIIAVHLCGNPCDLHARKAITDRHSLLLIEHCAQAWGAKYRGEPVGTVGHLACWSLQNSKHITCGDDEVVASNDERFDPLLQRFGDKGFDRVKGGLYETFATNYRMTEPEAAVATAQLERLESIVQHLVKTKSRDRH